MKDLDVKALINDQVIPLAKNVTTGAYESMFVAPDTLHAMQLPIDVTAIDEAGNSTSISAVADVLSIWIPPKTDWQPWDTFNIEDWRRIMGNELYLHDLSLKMYPAYEISQLPGPQTYAMYQKAKHFNDIVANLNKMIQHTFPFDHPSIREFNDGGIFIDNIELNYIESTMLQMYEYMTGQYEGLRVLAFTLGGDEFGD